MELRENRIELGVDTIEIGCRFLQMALRLAGARVKQAQIFGRDASEVGVDGTAHFFSDFGAVGLRFN